MRKKRDKNTGALKRVGMPRATIFTDRKSPQIESQSSTRLHIRGVFKSMLLYDSSGLLNGGPPEFTNVIGFGVLLRSLAPGAPERASVLYIAESRNETYPLSSPPPPRAARALPRKLAHSRRACARLSRVVPNTISMR